jgi:uncharacterized protein
MDVTPLIHKDRQVIQSYAPGQFKVSDTVFSGPVIVMPDRTVSWDVLPEFSSLDLESFKLLEDISNDIDLVLVGCGSSMQLIPNEIKYTLADFSLTLESMDTGAACRTYNVLMAEGRRVAAAMLPL